MSPRQIQAELLDPAGAELGEGPTWDAGQGCLVWVDILGGHVHLTEADGARRATHDVATHVGAALPAVDGGWLLAARDGFAFLSPDGSVSPVLSILADQPQLRFNDAKCDGRGRAFAGTMAYDMTPGAASLYRLDAGPSAVAVVTGMTCSNGMAWTQDERTMYLIDSPTRVVRAFDYDADTGALSARRVAVEVSGSGGVPDGMTLDHDGCLWVAVHGTGTVHRYSPEGVLDTIVRCPVEQVTSCCFGGPGGARLYVTSARENLDADQLARQPLSGALFVTDLGVSGPAASPWRPVTTGGERA